jgi:hypothetical protein
MIILSAKYIPEVLLREYWENQAKHDRLKYRFGDVKSPDISVATTMYRDNPDNNFYVISRDRPLILGECLLLPAVGSLLQIHFSLRPKQNIRENIRIAKWASDYLLSLFTNYDGFLGITPTDNKAACKILKPIGFCHIATIPYAAHYMGKPTSGYITLKEGKRNG